jgi:hypothetical protein
LDAFEKELNESKAKSSTAADDEEDDGELVNTAHLDDIDEAELGEDPFAQNDAPVGVDAGNEAWLKSDRDYTYQEVGFSLCWNSLYTINVLNSCLHDSTHHFTPPTHPFFPIRPKNDTPSRRPPYTVKETRSLFSQTSPTYARRCIVRSVPFGYPPVVVI